MNFNICSSMSYGGQFGIYITSIGFIVTTAVSQIQSISGIFTNITKAKKATQKTTKKATNTANHSAAK